jgi:DNA-binding NarL/FixJ family response regulator
MTTAQRDATAEVARTEPPLAVSRVLVVEDHPVLRSVITIACEQAPDLEVVGEVEDGTTALEICRRLKPDLMVLDLMLAGELQGLELARIVRSEKLPIKILVLTARTDDETVFDSVAAGVDGYLEKTAGVRSIAESLRRVASGERAFSPAHQRGAIAELGRRAHEARERTAGVDVTARELEVLEQAALGLTVGQIGTRMSLSPRTVETHLANTYRKLGARNRVQALAKASELGLIRIG